MNATHDKFGRPLDASGQYLEGCPICGADGTHEEFCHFSITFAELKSKENWK